MTTAIQPALELRVQRILASLGELPTQRISTLSLVLVSGLPGTGKSTFSRRLAAETGAIVLESDALRSLLFEAPTHNRQESGKLFPAIHTAGRQLLTQGYSVIFDATNLKEMDRHPVYAVAFETGARLVIVELTARREVVESRLVARTRDGRGAAGSHDEDAWLRIYRTMMLDAEPIRREHWRLDSSDLASYEETFNRILAELKPHDA